HRDGTLTDNDLQRALAMLSLVEVTGSATVPLTVALQPTPTYGIMLDGQRVTDLSLGQRNALQHTRGGTTAADNTIGHILADGTFNGSLEDLVKLVGAVQDRLYQAWEGKQLDDTDESRLARRILDDDKESKEVSRILRTPVSGLKGVSGAQCRALREL